MGAGSKTNQPMQNQYRPPTYSTYNNFNDLNVSIKPSTGFTNLNKPVIPSAIQPTQTPRFDLMDEDEIGEFIYSFVERIYPR